MTVIHPGPVQRTASPAAAPARSAGEPAARHQLGAQLRHLREARSLRLEDAAARLDVAASTLSRIETGQAPIKTIYLTALLDLYEVADDSRRVFLTDLARQGQRTAWLADRDLVPAGTAQYLNLEAAACRVRSYWPHAVPDLLQTRDYASAACRAARPGLTREQVARLVALQAGRQAVVHAGGHRLHLVVDEAALRRPIAPAPVMAGQLEYLLTLTAVPVLTLQVVPSDSPRPVLSPPFTLLDFSDRRVQLWPGWPGRRDQARGRGAGNGGFA
jgi:transcriptional regulator with XRE-family HTH domain